jgi:hypothetical protein
MEPVTRTRIALALVLVASLLFIWRYFSREGFASPEAIKATAVAQKVFSAGGETTSFSALKSALPKVDVVSYTDMREAYRGKSLTPERVEKILFS